MLDSRSLKDVLIDLKGSKLIQFQNKAPTPLVYAKDLAANR